MRAFFAVTPPAGVVEDLSEFVEPRRRADEDGEDECGWVEQHQVHLTLAFMAALPEDLEDDLVDAVGVWASRQSPLRMRLAGAGAFPAPERAKVLWIGAAPTEAHCTLARWSRSLRDLANHAGVRVDGMRFTPHVTIARTGSRGPRRAGRLLQALDGYRSPEFTVGEVGLVQSHLGGQHRRVRHQLRHAFPLHG